MMFGIFGNFRIDIPVEGKSYKNKIKNLEEKMFFSSPFFQNTSLEQPGMVVKEVGDLLNEQPDIENSYVMVPHIHYGYYINGKNVVGFFDEGIPNDTFENYVTRENWTDMEIAESNILSSPRDRQNIYDPKPDYLVYALNQIDGSPNQHEYLKILSIYH